MDWQSISEGARRTLLWNNAARCYARLGGRPPSTAHTKVVGKI